MSVSKLKLGAAATVVAVATALAVQAGGGSARAVAQDAADPFEGVWEASVTQRNCDTGVIVGTFRGAQVVHRGGTLFDTNASAPGSRGPGFGVWSRQPDGVYAVKFRFYRYNADGSLAGSNVVSSRRTLGADGRSYVGDTVGEVRSLDDRVLQAVCVGDEGRRFN
jgi:hypothetical protein